MIDTLALDTPGEICRKVLEHEHEVQGLVVFAFTGAREMSWGITGDISSLGLMVALQLLHEQAGKLNALITMQVEGNA
ncbi:hypothetical protein UFOVP143_43 [uncultured Caudovirales phage]|uniref:Uncharacterized protein n=1 Tax=uncultured Caudovirales phage TaxID=2100421 RepID=A0A6J7VPF1_9CAUD|nr:hypothetical protein UFOVP143_43 [uncultured Caudovirales phage]